MSSLSHSPFPFSLHFLRKQLLCSIHFPLHIFLLRHINYYLEQTVVHARKEEKFSCRVIECDCN